MNLMKTVIADLFDLAQQPNDMGIEIETEGTPYPFSDDEHGRWRVTEEPSLRYWGVEFVSRPFRIYDLDLWMETWREMTAKAKFKPSLRTSVHVHVNATRWALKEVFTVLTAYWLIEDELVRLHGKDREGNLHCLRLSDANSQVINLIQDLISNHFTIGSSTDNEYRYSAANLSSLKKHGTLEFRFLRGMIDHKEIGFWASALFNMTQAARTIYKSPRDVVNTFQRVPLSYFLGGLLHPDIVAKMSTDRERYTTNIALLGRLAMVVTELSRPIIIQSNPDLEE